MPEFFKKALEEKIQSNKEALEKQHGTEKAKAIMKDFDVVMDSDFGDKELKISMWLIAVVAKKQIRCFFAHS